MATAEIVGGVSLREVVEGGATFDVKCDDLEGYNDPEEAECVAALQKHLKLECLDTLYNGEEPFTKIGEQMQNLVPDGNIKKRVLREGYGKKPEEGGTAVITYNAYVQFEAEPFDSTYARKKPFSFKIGANEVIEGLEIAVRSMQISEKSQFLIQPELAYKRGLPKRVPPNSAILFEIELTETKEYVAPDIPEGEERLFKHVYPQALAHCVKGKNKFRLKDFRGAIKEYNEGTRKLEDAVLNNYEEQMKSEDELVKLYTNLLVCYTKLEIPKRGCIFAQKIYQMSRNGTFKIPVKVFFHHAKCQRILGSYDFAEKKLYQAKALVHDKADLVAILDEFDLIKKAREEEKQRQRSLGKALLNS